MQQEFLLLFTTDPQNYLFFIFLFLFLYFFLFFLLFSSPQARVSNIQSTGSFSFPK